MPDDTQRRLMPQVTKVDVDEARKDLDSSLRELDFTIRDWRNHPRSITQRHAARRALDNAERAFDEHERTLEAWRKGGSNA